MSIHTVPGRATCCGSSSSSSKSCTDDGTCEGKSQVKITNNATEALVGGPKEWDFTVTDKDGIEINTGVFSTGGGIQGDTFCAAMDEELTVTITLRPSFTPTPLVTPESDPNYEPPNSGTGSGSGYGLGSGSGSTSSDSRTDDPPTSIDTDTPAESPTPTSVKLLTFNWCPSCGSEGSKEFGEGSDTFEIKSSSSGSNPGDSSGGNDSVHFRINLGREKAGKPPVDLVIKLDTLEPQWLGGLNYLSPFSKTHVDYPGLIDAYDLEIWCWSLWKGEEQNIDSFPAITFGERKRFRYFGTNGYKSLFDRMGIIPIPRTATGPSKGPALPLGTPSLTGPLSNGQLFSKFIPNTHAGWRNVDDYVFQTDCRSTDSIYSFWDGNPLANFSLPDEETAGSDKSLDDYVRRIRLTMNPFIDLPGLPSVYWLVTFSGDTFQAVAPQSNPPPASPRTRPPVFR